MQVGLTTYTNKTGHCVATLFAALVLALTSMGPRLFAQERQPASSTTVGDDLMLPDAPTPGEDRVTVGGLPKRFVRDEMHFVQFPKSIGKRDIQWLVPLAGAVAASFATDEKTMSEVVSQNGPFNQTSRNVSDGLRDGLIALPVALLGAGQFQHNEHARETGILASEAMADSYVAGEIIKWATFRERPFSDRSEGSFYRLSAGTDSSFISGHSLVAWSSAAVLAAEYPNHWSQAGIYMVATGVSVTRVLGQEHFPSDVLLGSAAGWLIGHYVYRAHHHRLASHHPF